METKSEIDKFEEANTTLTKLTANGASYEIPINPDGKALKDKLNTLVTSDIGADRATMFMSDGDFSNYNSFADFDQEKKKKSKFRGRNKMARRATRSKTVSLVPMAVQKVGIPLQAVLCRNRIKSYCKVTRHPEASPVPKYLERGTGSNHALTKRKLIRRKDRYFVCGRGAAGGAAENGLRTAQNGRQFDAGGAGEIGHGRQAGDKVLEQARDAAFAALFPPPQTTTLSILRLEMPFIWESIKRGKLVGDEHDDGLVGIAAGGRRRVGGNLRRGLRGRP